MHMTPECQADLRVLTLQGVLLLLLLLLGCLPALLLLQCCLMLLALWPCAGARAALPQPQPHEVLKLPVTLPPPGSPMLLLLPPLLLLLSGLLVYVPFCQY
jgi:hypothetical protein